jgi:D-methionine transport system substrate-binding protein
MMNSKQGQFSFVPFKRRFVLLTAAFALTTLVSSCSTSETASSGQATQSEQPTQNEVLTVGVTPVPAGEILAFVRDELAPEAGLEIKIVEFNEFNQPNLALKEGELDANYFQHIPFMEDFGKQHDIDLVPLNAIHLNPVGAFSKRFQSLDELPDNATVTVPNDVTNLNRALKLLAENGLITLREGVGELATTKDITENPKNLQIVEIEAPSLVRSLDDVDVSVITGNFVVQAGMNTREDAIALEDPEGSRYAVRLATLRGQENDPRIQTLNELLVDPQVREFIEEKYDGAVIPVF